MYRPILFSTATPPSANLISRSPLPRAVSLILLVLALTFALSPTVRAVDPPPDGGYPNQNTAEGDGALNSLTTGTANTAVGFQALYVNQTSSFNTAVGYQALYNHADDPFQSDFGITAIGYHALFTDTAGFRNTAVGTEALFATNSSYDNTATGWRALTSNTTGTSNVANGAFALYYNTSGGGNTATGVAALQRNTSGNANTATGNSALQSNTIGYYNAATGHAALVQNTSGNSNTASGVYAMYKNTSGNSNTASGFNALHDNTTGSFNVAIGYAALQSNTTGNNNVAVGRQAGLSLTTGSNNIVIGQNVVGSAGEVNTTRIGKPGIQQKTFIAGIYGQTVASGVGVIINSSGQLGTILSSARFKTDIKPMDKSSEAILALSPVTFRYKQEVEPNGIPQFGLIAEEVEKVNPDLVVRDEEGKVVTVRYEAVNAMLLNEFLKEHRKVEELTAIVAKQETTNREQQKQIEALTTGLQKVAARIESNQTVPRVVNGN